MKILTIDKADFGYGGRAVLKNVSLSVSPEDFIGLIGPNGAGKSTLIRGLLGLVPPLRGTVTRDPSFPRHLGYVPQRGRLDPIYPLAVRDVVAMGYDGMRPWHRFSMKTRYERVRACLDKVGLLKFERRAYAELSGGQQQRVLIARALATEPRFLVLDEPTSGVDQTAENAIMDLLLEMNRRDRIAVLLVSHKLPLLRAHATVVWIAAEHRVVAGPTKDLLAPDHLAEILETVF